MTQTNTLLHGTLDLLILKAVAGGPRHGYEIVRLIVARTAETIAVEDGSLYPALYRLEKRGLIRGDWGISDAGRRARFYRLTDAGRRRLAEQTSEWLRFSEAVSSMVTGSQI